MRNGEGKSGGVTGSSSPSGFGGRFTAFNATFWKRVFIRRRKKRLPVCKKVQRILKIAPLCGILIFNESDHGVFQND
jgi:hypothetical protein